MTDIKRNVLRARYDDGLMEMGAGLGLLIVAGYFGQSPAARTGMAWMPGLLPIFIALAVRGLRRRFVYPRIGFAQPLRDLSWMGLVVVVAVLGLVGAVVLVSSRSIFGWQPGPGMLSWVFAFPALACAVLLASAAVQARRARFWLHAGVLAAAAIVPALFGLTPREHMFFITFAPAVVMLPTGIIVFTRFVRSHPVQEVKGDA